MTCNRMFCDTEAPISSSPMVTFAAQVVAVGSIYFSLAAEAEGLERQSGIRSLTVVEKRHLREHMIFLKADDDVIMNLSQSALRAPAGDKVPCFIPNAKLWSTKKARVMLGTEAVRMMWGGEPPFHFADLSNCFLKKVAGNGVHIPSIAAIMMWLLAGFQFRIAEPAS